MSAGWQSRSKFSFFKSQTSDGKFELLRRNLTLDKSWIIEEQMRVDDDQSFTFLINDAISHRLLFPFAVPIEEPIWCLDKELSSGHMFWRRDSSKVKFRCEVEVLEFERDPEELLMSKRDFHHSFRDQDTSHPIVVISTCICAIAVTVLLPWLMIGSNEPIE